MGSSDLSASLVSLPVIHESSSGRYCQDDVLDSHASHPAQISVCPQSDQIRQQADVGHAQDRATPALVAVIPLDSLDAGRRLPPLIMGKRLRVPSTFA